MTVTFNALSSCWLGGQTVTVSDRRLKTLKGAEEFDSVEKIQSFLHAFASLEFFDRIIDRYFHNGQKEKILKAMALCHVASAATGRGFLTGDEADQVELDRRYLLDHLCPEARKEMFRNPMMSGSSVVLTFPGTQLLNQPEEECLESSWGGVRLAVTDAWFYDGLSDIKPGEARCLLFALGDWHGPFSSRLVKAAADTTVLDLPDINTYSGLLMQAFNFFSIEGGKGRRLDPNDLKCLLEVCVAVREAYKKITLYGYCRFKIGRERELEKMHTQLLGWINAASDITDECIK